MTEPVALYAEFTARAGVADAVVDLLGDYARRVREEEGNLEFVAYRERDRPSAFFVYERYRDEAAFQAHLAAPYGASFNAALAPLIEEEHSLLTMLSGVE